MYQAELKGKLSSRIENQEDILTSNVFSFFKYADRQVYLKDYLDGLGIKLMEDEAENAEFEFWPILPDKTEPDVVIISENYYILIEAKYNSKFSEMENTERGQLNREVSMGYLKANNLGKTFRMIAITSDYIEPKKVLASFKNRPDFIWTNWQSVTNLLETKLGKNNPQERFVNDLYNLLKTKNLRAFAGFHYLFRASHSKIGQYIFYDFYSSVFRGRFIGFANSVENIGQIIKYTQVFYRPGKQNHGGING